MTYIYTGQLKSLLQSYHERIKNLEDKKYDIEYVVKRKDVEVQFIKHNTLTKQNSNSNRLLRFILFFC